jgi:hypothetical protein
MQRVADAWQAQAKSAQKELAAALSTIETMRASNSDLQTELASSRTALQTSREASAMESTEVERLSTCLQKATKDAEVLTKINEELRSRHEQAISQLQSQVQGKKDFETRLQEKDAETEQRNQEIAELKKKNADLEKDRRDLKNTVDSTMNMLEKKTAATLESATQRLAEKDEQIKLLKERLKAAEQTLAQMQAANREIESKFQQNEAALTKRLEGISEELKTKVLEAQQLRSAFDQEMQQIQKQFEEQLQEERQARRTGEAKIKDDTAKYWKDQLSTAQSNHKDELESVKKLAEDRIQQSEQFMKRHIDDEIDGGIKSLKLKHALDISEMQENFRIRIEEQVNREKAKAEAAVKNAVKLAEESSSRALTELESKHANELSKLRLEQSLLREKLSSQHLEEMREALRIEREELSVEKNAELHALMVQHREQMEELQAAFVQEKETLTTMLTKDFERRLKEQEESISSRWEAESAARVDAATRDSKAKYQSQLKSAVSAHKSKLEDKLKDKFALVAEEEESLKKREVELEIYWREKCDQEVAKAVQAEALALKQSHRAALDDAVNRMKQERDDYWSRAQEREKRDLMFDHEQKIQSLEAELTQKHSQALQALQRDLAAGHAQLLQRELAEQENLAREAEVNHKEEIAMLIQRHSKDLNDRIREAKEAARKEAKEALDAAAREAEGKLNRAVSEREAKITRESEQQRQRQESSFAQQLEETRLLLKRESDNATSKMTQDWKERQRTALQEANQQHRNELQTSLEAQKQKLEDRYKVLLADRDEIIAQLRQEIVSLVQSSNEDLSKSLLEQQATLIERHRVETQRQRDEISALESRHELVVKQLTEHNEAALISQRRQIEQAYQTELDRCNVEFAQLEAKHGDFVKTSSITRQKDELLALQTQREQFDMLLKTSLKERDEYHQLLAQRAQESFDSDKSRLLLQQERQLVALKAEHADQIDSLENALKAAEAKYKAQMAKDAEQRESKHREDLAELTAELTAHHNKQLAEMRTAERAAADAKFQEFIQEIGRAKDQNNDSTLTLARQRAEFEKEKLEAAANMQATIASLEQMHRNQTELLEEENSRALKGALTALAKEWEVKVAQLKSNHESDLKARLAAQEDEWNQLLKEVRKDHATKVDMLESVNNKHVEDKTKLNQEFDQERTSLRQQYQQQLALVQAELVNRHQQEIAELLTRLEAVHAKKVQEAKDSERMIYDRKIASLKHEIEQLSTANALERKGMLDQFEHEKQELALQHQRVLDAARSKFASDLLDVENKYRAEKSASLAVLQVEQMTKSESDRIAHQRELLERLNDKEAEFSSTWNSVVAKMRAENDQLLEDMNSRHKIALAAVSEENKRVVEGLEARMKRIETSRDELLNAELEKYNVLFARLEEERSRNTLVEERHRSDLQALRKARDEEVAALNEDYTGRTKALHDSHVAKMAELEAVVRKVATESAEKHRIDVAALETSHSLAVQQGRQQLELTIQEMNSRFGEQIHALSMELEKTTSAHRSVTSQLTAEKEAYAAALASLKQQYDDDTVKWNEDLDGLAREVISIEGVRDALKAENATLLASRDDLIVAVSAAQTAVEKERQRHEEDNRQLQQDLAAAAEEAQGHSMMALEFSKQVTELTEAVTRYLDEIEFHKSEMSRAVLSFQTAMSQSQAKIDSLEGLIESMRAEFAVTLSNALREKEDAVRAKYFEFMQQQMQCLHQVVETQGRTQQRSLPQIAELHQKFLNLVEDLPSFLRDTIMAQITVPTAVTTEESTSPECSPATTNTVGTNTSRFKTPISVLAQAEGEFKRSDAVSNKRAFQGMGTSSPARLTRSTSLPKATPAALSSPADQLIACILEGDVQGVRTAVRGVSGEDLRSDYWKSACKSLMPLHRAVAGLHFHGNEKQLYQIIEALIQLGANVHTTDRHGNTVLHRAIIVCTSKCVASIVKLLLHKGADVRARNKDGDMPIHLECKRLRSASVEVISLLLAASADANATTRSLVSTCLDGGSSKKAAIPDETSDGVVSRSSQGAEFSALQLVLLAGEKAKSPAETANQEVPLAAALNLRVAVGPETESFDDGDVDDKMLGQSASWQVWTRAAETLVKFGKFELDYY